MDEKMSKELDSLIDKIRKLKQFQSELGRTKGFNASHCSDLVLDERCRKLKSEIVISYINSNLNTLVRESIEQAERKNIEMLEELKSLTESSLISQTIEIARLKAELERKGEDEGDG